MRNRMFAQRVERKDQVFSLDIPLLSIVIPVHNEENRLPQALEKIVPFLRAQPYLSEIIVVENGSEDRTLELAQEFAREIPFLHVFHEEARGKGLAVKRGMLEAGGAYRFICDVDLSHAD